MSLRAAGAIPLPGGPGKGFDHADTVTAPQGDRIYVAHTAMDAIDVIDCRTNAYLRTIGDLPGVAGVLVDNGHDLLVTSDRAVARVSLFRCSGTSPADSICVTALDETANFSAASFSRRSFLNRSVFWRSASASAL